MKYIKICLTCSLLCSTTRKEKISPRVRTGHIFRRPPVPHSMPSSCPSWREFPTFGGAATPDRSNSVVCAWKTALGESLGVGVGVGVGVCDVLKEDRILSKSRYGISGLLAVSLLSLYCQYIIVLVPHCEHVGIVSVYYWQYYISVIVMLALYHYVSIGSVYY